MTPLEVAILKPYISREDDGSILIEWIGRQRRLYIAIERKPWESSIGYVWIKKGGGVGMWYFAPFEFLEGRI